MPQRLRRALVRGKRASFWHQIDDCLVLLHPDGRNDTDVPIPHLIDDDLMAGHYMRLADKRWVAPAAIDELREIAEGARR